MEGRFLKKSKLAIYISCLFSALIVLYKSNFFSLTFKANLSPIHISTQIHKPKNESGKIKILYGLNFSPYILKNENPTWSCCWKITQEKLQTRMEIIQPYVSWIRTFSTIHGLEKTGSIAHNLGIKVAVGAWINEDSIANQVQIQNLIKLSNEGYVDIAIVGSEVLLRKDLKPKQLLEYIRQVKGAIPKGIPVTTADVYSVFFDHPEILEEIDIIFANFYPFWEGVPIQEALNRFKKSYEFLKSITSGKEIIVSETGWPSQGEAVGKAFPSPENAATYFKEFISFAHTNGLKYFYFEAFDEPWKAQFEGDRGSHWGIMNSKMQFKHPENF